MKILITGACGHIGSYMIEKINEIKKIKKVYLIDNFDSQRYQVLFNLKKKKNYIFFDIDLSKNNLSKFEKVDYVLHLASLTNAQGSFDKKKEMFKNNLGCMNNIIHYCKRTKAKLIHLSSTSVYGKQAKIVSENDEHLLKPQSPYAEIKLIEENLLKKNSKFLKYLSFRFGTIAGVSKGIRFHTAINKFCLNVSLNEEIYVYKTAYKQYRPYLSLRDAFKLFKFCIEKDKFINSTFNVLSGNYTVKQIINFIKEYKKRVKIRFVKTEIMNQLSYKVEDKKLNKFGVRLNSDIKKDIKETLNLFKGLKYK